MDGAGGCKILSVEEPAVFVADEISKDEFTGRAGC
jgi:hypothetical protein